MKHPIKQLQHLAQLRDTIERLALQTTGIPWLGRKTPAPFMGYWPNITAGVATLRSGRRYEAKDSGWRVLGKPQSRRARHRLAVAARKARRA